MAALPPFLILLDVSALMAGSTRQWQEFSRLGDCFIPKVVLEEIQLLCNHAVDPAQERIAREFVRFFPDSGWKATTSIAQHPALKPAEGHALSKKARLSLATAQTAYGLARNRPDGLIVVVANDQGLIQRLRMVNTLNLCGIPLAVLVQWSRTTRKPAVVANQLHAMRLMVPTTAPTVKAVPPVPAPRSQPSAAAAQSNRSRAARRVFRPVQIFYNLLTLVIVAVAILAVWRVIAPVSFAKTWHQIPFLGQNF